MKEASLAIVIPAYNEFDRFPMKEYEAFLTKYSDACLCFVDDASTDQTEKILAKLTDLYPEQVLVLKNPKNLGKALSVRHGVLYCYENSISPALAYLDADLATSLEECYSLLDFLEHREFIFASRILKIGSVVERRFGRFLIGRIIATMISNILKIKVYDTQCGCKVFRADIAPVLFGEKFISRWLFDVELFSRILVAYGLEEGLSKMEEIPVKRWVDRGASKVKLTYFFRLFYDLYLINRHHKRGMRGRQAKISQ